MYEKGKMCSLVTMHLFDGGGGGGTWLGNGREGGGRNTWFLWEGGGFLVSSLCINPCRICKCPQPYQWLI